MKRTLSLILFVLFLFTIIPTATLSIHAATEDSAEEETLPEGAIAIRSLVELDMICNEYPADGYYYLTSDLDMTNDVSEYGDFYNNGAGWNPIGTSSVPFTGTLDGRGFTISGLKQTRTANYTGLVGYAKNAVIKNLTIDSAVISGTSYTGVVLGYGNSCSISDCTVSDFQLSASDYIGTVIGYGSICTVANCNVSDGTVTSSTTFAGGVAGYLTGLDDVNISNCTNDANVTAKSYAGGIAGYVKGTVKDCQNAGQISSSGTYTGGITAYAVSLYNCENSGTVSARATNVNYTGGVAGYVTNVFDCVNTGSVTGTLSGSTNKTSLSQSSIGGIAGHALALNRCYNLGTITGNGGSYYYDQYHYRPTGGYVTTATANVYVSAYGIQGSAAATLYCCYNAGTITGNSRSSKYALSGSGTISNCYNFGPAVPLSSSAAATNCYNANGIISSGGTAENCYYYADSAAGVGTLLTQRQLRIQSFFENWDFDAIWTMGGNEDYLYPELQDLTPNYRKSLTTVSIAALPDKVSYYDGDALDPTGALLRLTYDNDTTEKIDITLDMISDFDSSTAGEQTVTVAYKGFTTTFPVTVTMREVVSLEISSYPAKLVYLINESDFDPTGGVLTVGYNNGSTETIPMEVSMFTGFDSSELGINTLTLSYRSASVTMDIRIANPYEIFITNGTTYQIVVNDAPMDAILLIACYNDQQQMESYVVTPLDLASTQLTGTLPEGNCIVFLLDAAYSPLCECRHSADQ